MALPTYDELLEPLLRFLATQPEPVGTRQVYDALAARLEIRDEERQQLLPSTRVPVLHNRIGWAHDRLKRAGLSHCPRRSMWELTEEGRRFVAGMGSSLTEQQVEQLAHVPRGEQVTATQKRTTESPAPGAADLKQSPDERIEAALDELREQTASELLELIVSRSPVFFERLVLDLLHGLGYGTAQSDLLRVGKSGDGGIDGIISLDRLGLEKVYVQAKRWQNSVGRPEVQGFFGALAGRRATKGVLITTSTFTREAQEFATSVSDRIVLVDGERLTELMMDPWGRRKPEGDLGAEGGQRLLR